MNKQLQDRTQLLAAATAIVAVALGAVFLKLNIRTGTGGALFSAVFVFGVLISEYWRDSNRFTWIAMALFIPLHMTAFIFVTSMFPGLSMFRLTIFLLVECFLFAWALELLRRRTTGGSRNYGRFKSG